MTRSSRFVYRTLCFGAVAATLAASGLAIPPAKARPLPANAKNSVVLCTCDPSNVDFTDSNAVGNIWIGSEDGGGFSGFGSGTITGSVDFAQPNIGQFNPDGIAVTGGAIFNNANVTADLNAVITASQTLSGEPGATLALTGGGTINASSGMLDGAGNEVFTATINPSFTTGTTFTIVGNSLQSVVINIPSTGGLPFDGSIALSGGITADEVLFNFDSGSYETGTGGDTLMMGSVDPNPITTGTFLDPNGGIEINDFDIDGRVIGGDSIGIQITDSDLYDPDPVPEPTSLALLGAGLAGLPMIRRRRRRHFLRS